jgi:hypothetical protein
MAFIPLNKFKSVLDTLDNTNKLIYTTPIGVSTIVLSSQFTNTGNNTEWISISIDANADIPTPDFSSITSLGGNTGTADLIELNREFIASEITAYTLFRNVNSPTPFALNTELWKNDMYRLVDSVVFDLREGGVSGITGFITGFYDKDGNSNIQAGRVDEMTISVSYFNSIVQQIILNQPIIGSNDVIMLYQTAVEQVFDNDITAELDSDLLIIGKTSAINTELTTPTLSKKQPASIIHHVPIPIEDSLSPIISGKLVLENGYSLYASGSENVSVVLSLLESANE